MRAADALSVADLEQLAKRRLPRLLFDLIESGVEDEHGVARNRDAFAVHQLWPRYLIDVSCRDQRTTLFGRTWASPFGISPTGIAGIFRRDAELMLAEAAREEGVPFILAGASMVSIERIAAAAAATSWYQLYAARDPAISTDLIRRAREAGFQALVVTVDNPVYPKRERDLRGGFHLPIRVRPATALDALLHPGWLVEWLRRGGVPFMESWVPYAPAGASAAEVAAFVRAQSNNADHTWRQIEMFRALWPRTLIVKGIMHPADAMRAAECGADGVILSNHGGKTLDRAPATLSVLPLVKAAVGDRLTVMLDSGVRRGSDVVVARALGADFVFVGRATLYGVAAGGMAGARRALAILREEVDSTLALIGCPQFADLSAEFLFREAAPAHRATRAGAIHAPSNGEGTRVHG